MRSLPTKAASRLNLLQLLVVSLVASLLSQSLVVNLGPVQAAPAASVGPTALANTTWDWQDPLPQGNNLHGVSCITGNQCVAVGDAGTILAYDGVGWTPEPSATTGVLNGVSCIQSGFCVTVGLNNNVYTSNNYNTWNPITFSPVPTTSDRLAGVSCNGTNTVSFCAIAGYNGTIMTSPDGTNWTQAPIIPANQTLDLRSISCTPNKLCAIVGIQGVIIYSTDGTNWQLVTGTDPTWYLTSVSCRAVPTNLCVAVGQNGIIVTSTNGSTWTKVNGINPAYNLSGVSCINSLCVAVGQNGTILTSPNGINWTKVNNVPATTNLSSVSCTTAILCVVVSQDGVILTSANGTNWNTTTAPATLSNLNDTSCLKGDQTCTAVGVDGTIVTSVSGLPWQTVGAGLTVNSLNGVSCIDSTLCVAVGANGTVLTSANATTWALGGSPGPNYYMSDVSCPRLNLCVAVGPGGLILDSVNNAASWNGATVVPTTSDLTSVSCNTADFCVAVGQGVLLTSNGGVTWTKNTNFTLPNAPYSTYYLRGVSCNLNGLCVAVGSISCSDPNPAHCPQPAPVNSGLILTSIGGVNWSVINTTQTPQDLYAVSCNAINTCAATGALGTLLTRVNATTWQLTNFPTYTAFRGVNCSINKLCRAVGEAGDIVANYYTVRYASDNGQPYLGTLSRAFANSAPNQPIFFRPTTGTFTLDANSLNHINPGANWVGVCGPNGPSIALDGNNLNNITMIGNVQLSGFNIRNFKGPQIVASGNGYGPNKLSCVKVMGG